MAGIDVSLRLEGIEPIIRQLNLLDDRIRRKTIRKAAGKAAIILRKKARELCPIGDHPGIKRHKGDSRLRLPGNLRKSIVLKEWKFAPGNCMVLIGPAVGKKESFDGWYGRMVEMGTKNMTARPFMKPAFMATKSEMEETFVRELLVGLYG